MSSKQQYKEYAARHKAEKVDLQRQLQLKHQLVLERNKYYELWQEEIKNKIDKKYTKYEGMWLFVFGVSLGFIIGMLITAITLS